MRRSRRSGTRNLACQDALRDHTGHLAPGAEDGIGEQAHQPHACPAVDEPHAAAGERRAEVARHGRILRAGARARPAEHAEAAHGKKAEGGRKRAEAPGRSLWEDAGEWWSRAELHRRPKTPSVGIYVRVRFCCLAPRV